MHAGSFDAALRRVSAYAPARGHLAEVEAQLGEIDSAVSRLHSLAISSDDPDYAAQLARILAEAGRDHESWHWRRQAAARFDELMASRPEAFADHAAEFWLAAGADPHKALRLAQINVEVRNTPRARRLLAQAVAASAPSRRVAAPALANMIDVVQASDRAPIARLDSDEAARSTARSKPPDGPPQ